MRNWTKTAGLLFVATASVYSWQAIAAAAGSPAGGAGGVATDVKLLEEAAPSTAPATRPAAPPPSLADTAVNVTPAGTVEIHVNDASLVEVLRMLSMQSQRNIIASREVTGTVTANLYDVTVKEALDAILLSNGYGYKEKGNFIYVYTAKQLAEMEKADRKMATEAFRLHYTPAANAVAMLKPVLSPEAVVANTTPAANGVGAGGGDAGGNSHSLEDIVVITDYPEKLDAVRRVLKEVDRRPQQILVEATLVRAALREDNALGVDFNIIGGVDFGRVVHSNGQIVGAGLPDEGPIRSNSVGTGNNFTGGQPGFRVGVVNQNISVFLNALEGVTDTTVMANPKLLVLNKQKGEVHVGREDGYRASTVQTETSATESVQMLSTGIRLIFRPYIGSDGYIRMEVHPEDSNGSVDRVTGLPSKTTTEVTTNVMVRDGHTVVIGGLFREVQSSNRSQVPVLGNIPVAGALFRRQADATEREEVIILLTPHIVKDEDAYAAASEKEMKNFEKLRVGVRRGMMWTGRERLAEASYDKAVAELNKPSPDRKRALWHLNAATNLNPKFSEAINLKQDVTGRELTTVDNSSIRHFVARQIIAERRNPPATRPTSESLWITPPTHGHPTALSAPATQPAILATATTLPVAAAPATRPAEGNWLWATIKGVGAALAETAVGEPAEVKLANKSAEQIVERATTRPAGTFSVTELPCDEPPTGD